jgi:hypothetical protein
MGESTESISAFFVYFSFVICFGSFFPFLVHQFAPRSVISFLSLAPFRCCRSEEVVDHCRLIITSAIIGAIINFGIYGLVTRVKCDL